MEQLKLLLRGKPKVEKKFIRDSKGRAYYLKKFPIYYRYPRLFIFGGGTLAALITFSGVIYNLAFTSSTDLPPEAFLWPRERQTGITNLERIRMKYPSTDKRKAEAEQVSIQIKKAKNGVRSESQEEI